MAPPRGASGLSTGEGLRNRAAGAFRATGQDAVAAP